MDERATRRFINGERPISDGLLWDNAKDLPELIDEATAAATHIRCHFGSRAMRSVMQSA